MPTPAPPKKMLDLHLLSLLTIILPTLRITFAYQQNVLQPDLMHFETTFWRLLNNPPQPLFYLSAITLFVCLYQLSNRKRTPDKSQHLALQASSMAVTMVGRMQGADFQTMALQYYPSTMLMAMLVNEWYFSGVEIRERNDEQQA